MLRQYERWACRLLVLRHQPPGLEYGICSEGEDFGNLQPTNIVTQPPKTMNQNQGLIPTTTAPLFS